MTMHRRNTTPEAMAHERGYSDWHRWRSTRRFLGNEQSQRLTCFDVDMVEMCHLCHRPLALFEMTRSNVRTKPVTYLIGLAELSDLPAYVVRWVPGSDDPAEILSFDVDQVHPVRRQVAVDWSPAAYAIWLYTVVHGHHVANHHPDARWLPPQQEPDRWAG